jgi:hypothetical protein
MRSGELSLAIEIPRAFARDVLRGQPVQIGAWIDGAMPQRAETVQGYVQGMHQHWLLDRPASAVRQRSQAMQRRDALSLQPRRQEPAGHGAGGDSPAAADAAGDADRAGGGAREGDWARSSISTSRR